MVNISVISTVPIYKNDCLDVIQQNDYAVWFNISHSNIFWLSGTFESLDISLILICQGGTDLVVKNWSGFGLLVKTSDCILIALNIPAKWDNDKFGFKFLNSWNL